MIAYGTKGCNCFYDDDWAHTWQPNVSCRFHGLLSDYTKPRQETGTYRVITPPPEPDPSEGCGYHQEGQPCPNGHGLPPLPEPDDHASCGCGLSFSGPRAAVSAWILGHEHKIETKEKRGVLAAIRRWSRGGHRVFSRRH